MAENLDQSLWLRQLTRSKAGKILGTEANIFAALKACPALTGLLRYNSFEDTIEFTGAPPWDESVTILSKWSDFHRIHLQVWLQEQGFSSVRGTAVQDAVIVAAMSDRYHPVQDQIKHIAWDQTKRLDTWLAVYLGCEGDEGYLKAVGRGFMVGAIARLFRPGCKCDNVLVLEGPQGVGKSTVVQVLSLGYSTDGMPDLHSKDAAIHIQGTWINELPELAAMAKSEIEPVKAFLARVMDRYRPPYGRNTVDRPRGCVFIATTNLHEYLNDESGGRRFWPVRCRKIELGKLRADVEQLWAEAFMAWIDKEDWHLGLETSELAKQEQDMRRFKPETEIKLLEYLDESLEKGRIQVEMRELLTYAAGIEDIAKAPHAGAVAKQYSRILAANGWEKMKSYGRHPHRRQPYRYAGKITTTQGQLEPLEVSSQAHASKNHEVADIDDDDIPF